MASPTAASDGHDKEANELPEGHETGTQHHKYGNHVVLVVFHHVVGDLV